MVGISSAVAEDKLVEAKSTKNPDIQLNDIIKVLVDERPTVESRAVAAQKATSRFKKIAASVLAIEPNGDLRIEGRSKTLVGDEVLERTMTGKLRRQSLQADRSVRQDDVAEFRYRIRKKPMLHDAIAPDAIMPNPVRQVAAEMVESPKTAELRQKLVE